MGITTIPEETATAAADTSLARPWVNPSPTEYVMPMPMSLSYSTSNLATDRVYYAPFVAPADFTNGAMAISVTVASAGRYARVCVYASDSNGRPTGSPIAYTGDLDCSTTGLKEDSGSTAIYNFQRGVQYWLGIHSQGGMTVRACNKSGSWEFRSYPTAAAGACAYYQNSASFALGPPSVGSIIALVGTFPAAFLRG